MKTKNGILKMNQKKLLLCTLLAALLICCAAVSTASAAEDNTLSSHAAEEYANAPSVGTDEPPMLIETRDNNTSTETAIAPPPETAAQNITVPKSGDEPQRDANPRDETTIGLDDDTPVVPPKANDDATSGEANLIYALDANASASPFAAAAILGTTAAVTAAVLAAAAVVSHRKSMAQ